MNSFSQILIKIYELVKKNLGSAIDLAKGGNSYLFYNVMAQIAFITVQAQNAIKNYLSIFSSTGNQQNSLGVFLNYKNRPYYPVVLNCIITGTTGTTIHAGLEATYTDINGNVYYFVTSIDYTIEIGTTVSAEFFYIGDDVYPMQNIPVVPLSIVPDSTTITGGSISSVVNTVLTIPRPYSDLDFRAVLRNIYQQSANGLDGAIENSVKSFSLVKDCKVYVGNKPGEEREIIGKGGNVYSIPYNRILIIVSFLYDFLEVGSYIAYAKKVVAYRIFNRWNWNNITFDNDNEFGNQVSVEVTSVAGNSFTIDFYKAMITLVDVTLILASGSPQPNQENLLLLSAEVKDYINSRGIAGSIYFSEIGLLAIKYGLLPIGLKINTVDGNQFTAAPDEDYRFNSFTI